MATAGLLKRAWRLLPLVTVAGLLLIALFLVAGMDQEGPGLARLNLLILLLTAGALLVLVLVITLRMARLLRQLREGLPGARMRARLVAVFVALALPPVVIVYLFSLEFLDRTISGWFDTGAEPALADSIELGQLFLDLRTRQARSQMQRLAERMPTNADEEQLLNYLFANISRAGPTGLTLLQPSGRVEALVDIDPQRMVADLPSAFALGQAAQGQQYSAAEAVDGDLRIRVLTPLAAAPGEASGQILQGIFPLPPEFSGLATGIEQAYFRYENVSFLRQRLQQSLVLILSLVLGITALLAIVLAFNAASRLVRPIRELAEATEILRAGEFPETIDVPGRDEIGFLVESFNRMATALHDSQKKLESQRQYLETLLGRMSAGVVAFDAEGRLETANQSASSILEVDLGQFTGTDADTLAARLPQLAPLFDLVARHAADGNRSWHEEIRLEQPERTRALVCRGSVLPAPDNGPGGHVVVFDDVTMLDQAQRQAAWAELARRLAHEVKNPLTPIRLAAERLQLRLSQQLEGDPARLLERSTGTIISQVDALRRLVDAFGDYTRPGGGRREPFELQPLIDGVVDLWSAGDTGVRFELALEHGEHRAVGDEGQFQQVLNNLVRNAREAHPEASPTITIRSAIGTDPEGRRLVVIFEDDGPGFDPAILERAFEPYATTKTHGTGLGLAIVRRILGQMGGEIDAGNRPDGGARLTITLPLESNHAAQPGF
ncbi:MAG: ATP-binding protein [Wenzhouxiangellaceae bacterium]